MGRGRQYQKRGGHQRRPDSGTPHPGKPLLIRFQITTRLLHRFSPRGGKSPLPRSAAGLTLLEVLISLAILGIGLAVIMQGLSLGLRVRRDSAESQRLSQVAENRLNDLLSRQELPPGTEEGTEGPYRWRLEQIPLEESDGDDEERGITKVRIEVEAPSGRSWELFTLFPIEQEESP